jgi:phage tail-like protein
MAKFTVNSQRIDPYANFLFRVVWDDEGTLGPIAGVSKVSGLKRTTELITYAEGGDWAKRHMPGRTSFEPITIERGITYDLAFEKWATKVYSTDGFGDVSLRNFRKDIIIQLYNPQGVNVRSWHVLRCWVSEYVAAPELDANANAVAFEHIVLQNEGFARDSAVVEVAET